LTGIHLEQVVKLYLLIQRTGAAWRLE
jgi:hypothetical protein